MNSVPAVPIALHCYKQSWTSQRQKPTTDACFGCCGLLSQWDVGCVDVEASGMWGATGDGIRLGKSKDIFFFPHCYWRTRKAAKIFSSSEDFWLCLLTALFINWPKRAAEEVLGWVALLSQLVSWADPKQKTGPSPAKYPSKTAWGLSRQFCIKMIGHSLLCWLFYREEQPSSTV